MSLIEPSQCESFLALVEDVFQCLGWETAESALRGNLTSVPESEVCIRWKNIQIAALHANLISLSGREETDSAQYVRSQSVQKTLP